MTNEAKTTGNPRAGVAEQSSFVPPPGFAVTSDIGAMFSRVFQPKPSFPRWYQPTPGIGAILVHTEEELDEYQRRDWTPKPKEAEADKQSEKEELEQVKRTLAAFRMKYGNETPDGTGLAADGKLPTPQPPTSDGIPPLDASGKPKPDEGDKNPAPPAVSPMDAPDDGKHGGGGDKTPGGTGKSPGEETPTKPGTPGRPDSATNSRK